MKTLADIKRAMTIAIEIPHQGRPRIYPYSGGMARETLLDIAFNECNMSEELEAKIARLPDLAAIQLVAAHDNHAGYSFASIEAAKKWAKTYTGHLATEVRGELAKYD